MSKNIDDQEKRLEIHVPKSDTENLTIIDRADIVFAIIYSCLFKENLGQRFSLLDV